MRKKAIISLLLAIACLMPIIGCRQEIKPTTVSEIEIADKTCSGKEYSPTLLDEERESITVGKLSPNHMYYGEVVGIDPECRDYIEEISIYDKEMDDTYVVHVSLPPQYEEGKREKYPMVIMTDGIWRLSDHPQLRPMIADGEIEPVILVSIGYPIGYNVDEIRWRELTEQPDTFLHFIVDNLVPYLLESYPASSEDMTLTGHSLGGFWTYYAMFHSDNIGRNTFSNYYIGSPSMQASSYGKNLDYYEKLFYDRKAPLNCSAYVAVGALESNGFRDMIESFYGKINRRDYVGDHTFTFETIDFAGHNTVFKPSLKNALKLFYGKDAEESE